MIMKKETALNNINTGWAKCYLWSNKLKDDKELMKLACIDSLLNLEYIPDQFKRDKYFFIELLKEYSKDSVRSWFAVSTILQYVSEELYDDKEFMEILIQYNYHAMSFASDRLQHDIDFVLKMIGRNVGIYDELPKDMRNRILKTYIF